MKGLLQCRMTVGLLGGSFNPAHAGHRYICEQALKLLNLDQVWWLVSPGNPLKDPATMAPFAERLASAKRQAAHPHFRVSGIEKCWGLTYSYRTIVRLQRAFPRIRFVWLMGADNLAGFHHWKRWQTIFHTIPIAVFDREVFAHQAIRGIASARYRNAMVRGGKRRTLKHRKPPAWAYVHIRKHPLSSTQLRAGLKTYVF